MATPALRDGDVVAHQDGTAWYDFLYNFYTGCSRSPLNCSLGLGFALASWVGTAIAETAGQVNIMKKPVSVLVLGLFMACSLAFGCAGTGTVRSGVASAAARGTVVTRGQAVKAIVQGPAVIHAYTADFGGGLYTAHAVTGSDSDCGKVSPAGAPSSEAIRREERVVLKVERGQIACLATSSPRKFELLWHAHDDGGGESQEVQIAFAPAPARAR
jgi:hypothetical protein